MLAVGGNAHAAQLSGISVPRAIITAHVISGLIAAAAGVLAVAQLGSAQPSIGAEWLVISFAAPIIGGASLAGGSISILGTVIAVMLIGVIQNAMVLLAVDPYWVTFLLGALILTAVWINRYRAYRMGED
jgi:ribose transport system permease protein